MLFVRGSDFSESTFYRDLILVDSSFVLNPPYIICVNIEIPTIQTQALSYRKHKLFCDCYRNYICRNICYRSLVEIVEIRKSIIVPGGILNSIVMAFIGYMKEFRL